MDIAGKERVGALEWRLHERRRKGGGQCTGLLGETCRGTWLTERESSWVYCEKYREDPMNRKVHTLILKHKHYSEGVLLRQ